MAPLEYGDTIHYDDLRKISQTVSCCTPFSLSLHVRNAVALFVSSLLWVGVLVLVFEYARSRYA
ncbi:hypothetical protein IQ249_25200 [Lusitaniella coriacea LEGE 07157]|uniref:Uncharacterized protein n=1 Tax=Lusitaniella coriacea LEGE 07157 TaxID=945747 RepID=A0A8J7JF94_9CYAN|nr:hypothetical protein [Lusitaniella coriacea]MBE9119155.1 hypothetical protein [Lusitaniella coriacea LEGE 07157]